MQCVDFEGELNRIVEEDSRYEREAYVFLRQALDFCQRLLVKSGKKKERAVTESTTALETYLKSDETDASESERLQRSSSAEQKENHISVAQLLDGIRQYALHEYGPMAMMVLNSWGVKSCEDFGEIVFKMVEHRLLSVTEQDTREEFAKGYNFEEAFRAPFKPGKAKPVTDNPAEERSAT